MEANVMREDIPNSYDLAMKVNAVMEKATLLSTQLLHMPLKLRSLQKPIQRTRKRIANNSKLRKPDHK